MDVGRDDAEHQMRRRPISAQIDHVDVEHRADQRRIGVKAPFPHTAAEDDGIPVAVAWGERAPSEIREAEDLEEIRRHPQTMQSLAGRRTGQIDGSRSIASNRLERGGANLPVGQVQ
jgi:hypothetical protein